MTYEEIREKYKDQVKARKSSIKAAQTRLDFLKQLRQNYIDTREMYRSNGQVDGERRKKWEYLSRNITRLNDKIAAAEIELGRISLGETGLEDLMKNLKL